MRVCLTRAGVGWLVSLALGGACLLAQGPLPGDVGATRLLQALFGDDPGWARFLTKSARAPGLWATLLLAIGLAGIRGGRRAALVPPLALIVALLLDVALRALIFAPRPDASLVKVASASAGSGLPSTFALVYGALFGAVLFVRARTGGRAPTRERLVGGLAAGMIVAGGGARIVLGGHWASQVLASLALACAAVLALRVALQAAMEAGRPSGRDERRE